MKNIWHIQGFYKSWSPGQPEHVRKKGLSVRGDEELDVHSDRAPEILCGDGIMVFHFFPLNKITKNPTILFSIQRTECRLLWKRP